MPKAAMPLRINKRTFVLVMVGLLVRPPSSSAVKFTTECHQQGWWTFSLAPRDKIAALLPHGFSLAAPNSTVTGVEWPQDKHPFMLETQTQSRCTDSILPFVHTTFHEFKLEIPFLVKEGTQSADLFMYKPLLYADTWTDVIGAVAEYDLNIHKADSIKQSDSSFEIIYEHDSFVASFNATAPWRPAAGSKTNYALLEHIATLPWLCEKDDVSCAFNRYDLNKTVIRPARASVRFGTSILPDLGLTTFSTEGIDVNVFGSVQLDTVIHISEVTSCP